ncbi:lysophospholipid acyltransferase 7 [Trichonephila clavata]|uniref:Lysophospholipid acyltransferase 7 n=1 Tax=Trichonephila clavata TaxID=2740835 RepID=A0A8X6H4U0_TRICU|nr:lysophospholipid acyltransferase 7 [Trichonephila clavata]
MNYFSVYFRKCHIVSAIFCFGYLAFFRSTHYFGLPIPPTHTNAIQMILTLKMVGLAFEIQGIQMDDKTKQLKNADLLKKYQKINPSFIDVFHYAFCIAGVLIGPYYKFRTYWDSFHLPYSSRFASSPEIMDESFWYRVFYMTPSFFNFRMRIYSGFILGECVCIAMGLGAYPKVSNPQPGAGPTNFSALEELWVFKHFTTF